MIIIFFFLLVSTSGLESCQEFITYEKCIDQSLYQCEWNSENQLCQYSTNFLNGCSAFLSRLTCRKQLAYSSGEIAKCRYDDVCEDIPDLQNEYCAHDLSKHGCLSVQNPQQLCLWNSTNYECTYLDASESFQDGFITKLYSASACSLIQHYLVIHSSLLWQQLDYTPSFVDQAQYQFRKDLDLDTYEPVKTYDDPGKVQLANNYINSNEYFVQYNYGKQEGYTLTNLQISDRTREGCIALEIADDSDFDQLIIKNFSGLLIGVNHIYCRYLGNAVFVNGGCMKIEQELQLTNQEFINKNNITCASMGAKLCSYYRNDEYYCQLFDRVGNNEKEFSCIKAEDQNNLYGNGIYYMCKKQDTKYLDIDATIPECSSKCSTYRLKMSECAHQSSCIALVSSADYDNKFEYCAPRFQCQQPGIGKLICIYLPALCNYSNGECLVINNYELYTLKCTDIVNKYTCSKIITEDQLCIWLDTDLKCINVLDDPLFSQFKAFPINYIVNFNLCVNYRGGYYQYSQVFRVCEQVTDLSKFTCDSEYINMDLCLSLYSQKCSWDFKYNKCRLHTISDLQSMSCLQLKYYTSSSCQYAVSGAGICAYDDANYSCIEILTTDLHCEITGLTKDVCVNISNEYNYCRWLNDECVSIEEQYLESEDCSSFINVNRLVCVRHNYNGQPCMYDSTAHKCYISYDGLTTCSNSINRYSCQLTSTAQCYFRNNKCQSITDYSSYGCDEYYVNYKGCILNSVGSCIWNGSACETVWQTPDNCTSMQSSGTTKIPLGNAGSCRSYALDNNKTLDIYKYCIYDPATGCKYATTDISDCDSNLNINVHRCTKYAKTARCMFYRQTCMKVSDSFTKLELLRLNTIKCQQANRNICKYITTPGQACEFETNTYSLDGTRFSSLIDDQKCGTVASVIENIGAINISPGVCSLTSTPSKCLFYNSSAENCGECSKVGTDYSKQQCSTSGLNNFGCTKCTYGSCIFLNNTCQLQVEGTCTARNFNSCINARGYKCSWGAACQGSLDDCVVSDRNDSTTKPIPSWSVCSMSTVDCYGNKGVCVKGSRLDLDCNVPGISKSVCNKLSMYCKYIDNQCIRKYNYTCEQLKSFEECVWSSSSNCVYDKQVCYTQNHKHPECDYYENTNYLYCRQYSECIYDWNNYVCVRKAVILDQLKPQTTTLTCTSYTDLISCTHQLENKCQYATSCSNASLPASCPHLQSKYSKAVCLNFPKCEWRITKSASYCFDTTKTITCSQMDQTICLSDISDTYKCVYDVSCIDNTYTTCASVQTKLVNYPTCKSIPSCEYDHQTSLCKYTIPSIATCSTFNGDQLGCALIIQKACQYSTNTCIDATATFSANYNLFKCISLTGSDYYYNKQTFQCISIVAADYEKVVDCTNLNKDFCLKKSGDLLGFICYWDSQCLNVRTNENYTLSCSALNKLACQKVESKNSICKWNSGTFMCESYAQSAHNCVTVAATAVEKPYSNSICAIATTACMINPNNTGCETVNEPNLEFCEGIGLSQIACLNNTPNIACKWTGSYCMLANLNNTECIEQVSQYTCLHITTPGQLCNWVSGACVAVPLTDVCSAPAISEHNCKQLTASSCIFEDGVCKSHTKYQYIECNKLYSKNACKNTINTKCQWINDECQSLKLLIACVQLHNKYACMNTDLYCIWDDVQGCHSIPLTLEKSKCNIIPLGVNAIVCKQYALDYCEFNYQTYTCGSAVSSWSSSTTWNLQLSDSSTYTQTYLTLGCQLQLTKQDCLKNRVLNLMCQWDGITCIKLEAIPTTCSESYSYYACKLANCIWRMNRCLTNYDLNQDQNPYPDLNTDVQQTITCDTPNISKLTCLNITSMQCQYNAVTKVCHKYVSSNESKCSDIQLVNSLACINQQTLKCSYNGLSYSCIDSNTNTQSLDLYSINACLTTTYARTYWNDGCHVITGTFYCDEKYQTNALACTQTWGLLQCAYDTHQNICHSKFNINSVRCTDQGINYTACVTSQYEGCIWQNNSCQQFTDVKSRCNLVKDVNEISCKMITRESCMFDYQNKRCKYVDQQQECSTRGLNELGCALNDSCFWNPDYLSCVCGEVKPYCKNNCLTSDTCNSLNCQLKKCEDYSSTDCKDIKFQKRCYVNIHNECQSATKCEDILLVNFGTCQNYYFDGYACVQIGTQCATHNNFELICPFVANCENDNCILDGSCRAKTCSDYTICPATCLIDEQGNCAPIQTCQQLSQTQCNSIQINNQYCSFQIYSPYSYDQVCTLQPCAIFGNQKKLCHGNEIAYYTCVLNNYCQPCEGVLDQCTCIDAAGICKWKNNQCESIFCSEYATKEYCLLYSRCMWNDDGCKIRCGFVLLQEDCDSRVGECYYDTVHSLCQEGTYTSPDLSVHIDVTIVWGHILSFGIIMILL